MPVFTKPTKIEKLWASNGDQSPPPDDAKIAQGFIVEIPTLEQFNYIEYKQDAMLAHLNQRGVSEYDVNSTYIAGKSYVQAPVSGIIYVAKLNNGPETIVVAPEYAPNSGTYWTKAFHFATDVYTITQSSITFLSKAANLADLPNINTARSNLSVYSKAETDNKYMWRAANFIDVANPVTAFNNIKQQANESYDGVARFANDSEVVAGSSGVMVAPSKLKLGFSLTTGTNGQFSFPSWLGGLIIQWGTRGVNANSTAAANLSRTFPSTCFMGVVSMASSNVGTDQFTPKAYATGASLILVNTGPTENFSWIAIGI